MLRLPAHRRMVLLALLLVCPLLVAAQRIASTTTPNVSHGDEGSASTSSAPAAGNPADVVKPGSQYPLGVADVIHVSVWKNTELTQTLTVGPDGFISMPLLGDIHVAGRSTTQLAHDLEQQLSRYVVGSPVTVSLVETHSRQVYVTGQVGKSGAFAFVTPITVLQAIAQAGGLTMYANRKKIFVLRTTMSQVQRIHFDYNSAVRGDTKQIIFLQPGDTVIVP